MTSEESIKWILEWLNDSKYSIVTGSCIKKEQLVLKSKTKKTYAEKWTLTWMAREL
jgi:hypothetical protein